jgi:hypothetical protein
MTTPKINVNGYFKFKEPYSSVIHEEQKLKVIAVRSIEEMIDDRLDVFKHVYDVVHLGQDAMDAHRRDGIPIIVFQTEAQRYIYVPNDYIANIPSTQGIDYQEKMLGIKLGSLPTSLSLEGLKLDIIELIKGRIGVITTVKEVEASAVTFVSKPDDAMATAARDNVMMTSETFTDDGLQGSFFLAYLRQKEEIEKLQTQVNNLKCAVKKIKGV